MALEPRRDGRGDGRRRQRRPAEADQHEAGVELPGLRDLADQRDARGHAGGPGQQDGPGAPARDGAADGALERGAHQEEQGDRRGDLGDRPAMRGRDGLQVDTRPEQAEAPGDGGDDEAGRDDPPAMERAPDRLASRVGPDLGSARC